jgi:hypothetical protein
MISSVNFSGRDTVRQQTAKQPGRMSDLFKQEDPIQPPWQGGGSSDIGGKRKALLLGKYRN